MLVYGCHDRVCEPESFIPTETGRTVVVSRVSPALLVSPTEMADDSTAHFAQCRLEKLSIRTACEVRVEQDAQRRAGLDRHRATALTPAGPLPACGDQRGDNPKRQQLNILFTIS